MNAVEARAACPSIEAATHLLPTPREWGRRGGGGGARALSVHRHVEAIGLLLSACEGRRGISVAAEDRSRRTVVLGSARRTFHIADRHRACDECRKGAECRPSTRSRDEPTSEG